VTDRAVALADSRNFRAVREDDWRRLEAILTTAEKRSVRALSDEDLLALPILYRGALSSLSVARETSLDLELVNYLEGLSARAYFFVYGVRTTAGSRLSSFFACDWPNAVRTLWKETIAATLLTIVGIATGLLLVNSNPLWFDSFVPGQLAGGRNFSASADYLRSTLYHEGGAGGLGTFATYLFTHNSQVCIFSFALGFMFGVPTAMLIIYNGAILGAMFSLFGSHGLGFELGGWLIIHGSTEFFAIILAGAAGLRIGWAVVFPGEETRMASATRAGRTSAIVMGGVIVMLLVAGLLEGFGRQLITNNLARYAIGGTMLTGWLLYFYVPRRQDRSADA
jgi:uncharacterized membrane protein SpoIIM required for sporulation